MKRSLFKVILFRGLIFVHLDLFRISSLGFRISPGGSPLYHHCCPAQAAAEAHQHYMVALLKPSLLYGLAQSDRDRGCRGVAIAVYIDEYLLRREFECLGGRFQDAGVGLMRNDSSMSDKSSPAALTACLVARQMIFTANLNTSGPFIVI